MTNVPSPVDMGNGVWLIDLLEQGLRCRSGAYLILDEHITLVETGSAVSHDVLCRGMAALGVEPKALSYVIVTHVHLDHAGGAGQMMEKATNARLVVHPRGARHMANPSRLWAGATQVYGERAEELFGKMVPVPEERILVRDDGEELCIGQRTLTFFDSPGHAKHHFTIFDSVSHALFAGDAVGIRYRTCFTGWDFEWVMPSSSPVDFDPDAVERTLNRLATVPFDWIYHTHFGKSSKAEAIEHTKRCAWQMASIIQRVYHPGIATEEVADALREWVRHDLAAQGYLVPANLSVLDIDIILNAMGLIVYEEKKKAATP